jgi:FeS assembly protein IscX
MPDTYHWLDVQRIAEELADAQPGLDPVGVNFVELRDLVLALPGFEEQDGHPVNERILETIQRLWIEEREGLEADED